MPGFRPGEFDVIHTNLVRGQGTRGKHNVVVCMVHSVYIYFRYDTKRVMSIRVQSYLLDIYKVYVIRLLRKVQFCTDFPLDIHTLTEMDWSKDMSLPGHPEW